MQLNNRIRKIEEYFDKGSIIDGIRESEEAISIGKEALSYFRQYQRIRFLLYLSIMWLGWIVVLFLKITGTKRRYLRISLLVVINIGFASLLIIILIRHAGKKFISKCIFLSRYKRYVIFCYKFQVFNLNFFFHLSFF